MAFDLSRAVLERAAQIVQSVMPPTPQLSWPLLNARAGCEVWVKHENHTATGAFKIRGGIVMLDALKRADPNLRGVISATRGNHGQSIAWSARRSNWPGSVPAWSLAMPNGGARASPGSGSRLDRRFITRRWCAMRCGRARSRCSSSTAGPATCSTTPR